MTEILLAGDEFTLRYNSPHDSRYTLVYYTVLNREKKANAFGTWQPEWLKYQLIHTFDTVIYTDQSWICTWDHFSFLRLIEGQDEQLLNKVIDWLAQDSCKKIITNSNYAKDQFIRLHQNCSRWEELKDKIEVIYPSFPEREYQVKSWSSTDGYLHLVFVGNSFISRGGIVALRLAQKAQANNFPLKIHIISHLDLNTEERDFYKLDLELLNLDNVIHHNDLSDHEDILKIISQCHFQLLAPLGEGLTYYQMLEGFSLAIPAITTNVGSLPEFNRDGETGYLLKLDLDQQSLRQWDIISTVYDNLVDQTWQVLTEFWHKPDKSEYYQQLSTGALAQIQEHHNVDQIIDRLDYLYAASLKLDIPPLITQNPPLVSVIIPLYNCDRYIEEAITSIFNQTYPNYEIVIVDDGSTDNSRKVLEPYCDRIRYIYQENQGVSTARNHAIKEAKGELVAFLDADDFFILPSKLEDEVACFQAQPSLGLLHSGWCEVDAEGKKIADDPCWLQVPQFDLETWLCCKRILPSAITLRRLWLKKVGGFNTRLTHSEDVELLLRLLLLGCEATWLEKITVAYRQHSGNASVQTKKRAQSLELVLERFFALPGLPENISQLHNQVVYYDLLWAASCFYQDGDFTSMAEYIQKAFKHSPYLRAETIYRCINQFDSLSERTEGKRIDSFKLTNLPEWQHIIKSLITAKQTVY